MPTAHNNNIGLSISGSVNGGGIKHFTNWDAGLTSIEFDQKEKFIAKQATKFLTGSTFYDQLGDPLKINFGADNVKIVDNFAAVSYPEYTDLAKSSFYFNDSHVYTIYDPDLYGAAANSLPSGFVYIPIFRFKELEKIINKEFIPSTYNNAGTDVEAVDLTGSFIVLHYHDDSLYAGPVEPQVLKYHRTLDLSEIEIGEFTLARIKAFGSIWLEQMSAGNSYDEDEFIIVANIGTDYKTVVAPTNSYYTPNCCSMVETPPPPPPPPPPEGCTDAYWTNYLGEGEGKYIQITGVAGTEFTINLNDYSGGIYNTGITEEDIDHWAFLNLPVGVDQLYEIITFSTSTSPGSYVATAEIYNICQEGPHDTIQFNIELGFGGSAPSNIEPQNDDKQLFGSANEIGSIPCDIEFIKYKPIIGCGKVDVYYINKGVITDYTNQIATCTNHHLKSGDVIRIFGALDASNGSYYVDPIDENTFYIYREYSGEFRYKLFINTTDDIQFIKTGNVLDSNETTWQLHSSLTSPRGRNGYGALFNMATQETIGKTGSEFVTKFNSHKRFWCDTVSKLPDCFNNTENFNQIFARDYGLTDAEFLSAQINPIDRTESILLSSPKLIGFERWPVDAAGPGGTYKNSNIWSGDDPREGVNLDASKDPQASFPFDPAFDASAKTRLLSCDHSVQLRSLYGIYDIWNTAYNLVNNFYFGASIDFKKDEVNNKYLLLVGERGFDTLFSLNPPTTTSPNDQTANVYYQLPQYGHGAAYLFEIKDVHDVNEEDDPNIKSPSQRVVLSDYYTAYKNDDDIAVPEPLVSAPFDYYLDFAGFFGYKRRYIFDTMWSNHTIARSSSLRSYPNCLYEAIPFPDSDNTDYLTMRGDRFPDNHPLFLGDNVVVSQQDLLNVNWGKIETETGHEYWYGSMLYGLANIKNGSTIYTHDKLSLVPPYYTEENTCTNAYFSNLSTLTIPDSNNIYDIYVDNIFTDQTLYEPHLSFRRNSFDVYPYVDNFGKSVALDIIDGDTYVFASSRTKPIINRPKLGGSCTDNDLPASYVGYIHVFKNGTKIQKIYETQAITFPSQKWQGSYYKADKFAICMHADKGQLFWGQTKGIEILDNDVAWTNEVSKIFVYENQNDTYTKTQTIENYNNRHLPIYVNIQNVPDYKEYYLRNLLDSFATIETPFVFYQPDRFGSCFKINKNLLVANSFDTQNELDGQHNTEHLFGENGYIQYNDYKISLDYLNVYILFNSEWRYIQKIAPAFNKNNTPYEYDSILFPAVNKSIRNLGNITYNNNVEYSRTWDIDLTNSFIVADNRIILKDPISYSIFEKDYGIIKNDTGFLNLPLVQNLTVNAKQYFTYDEELSAEIIPSVDNCNELIFTSLNGLYTFNYEPEDYKDIVYKNLIVNENQYLNITTPVYFISLPQVNFEFANINGITFTVEEIIAEPISTTGSPASLLRMVIFTKDPRTTVYPSYLSSNNLCSLDTAKNKIHSKYISGAIPFLYQGGALDSYIYAENSFSNDTNNFTYCNNNLCLAKIFTPTITTGDGLHKIHQFNIPQNILDISSLLIEGDLLLNSADNRSFSGNDITDTLEFNDLEKYGYDSSIDVQNTLIIGFIFDTVNSYSFNASNINYDSGIRINTIETSLRYNFSSDPTFIDNNGASLRPYKCILNQISNFDYITSSSICFADGHNDLSYSSNTLLYRKPVLGIGNANTALNQTRSEIYDGATTKSLEIISLDNINNSNNELAYIYTRHFNIQPLEYLPLFMVGESKFPFRATTLYINGPESSNDNFNLIIKAREPLNFSATLHLFGPLQSTQGLNLCVRGHRIITSPYLDYPYLFIRGTFAQNNNISLHMLGLQPVSMSLFVKGPLEKNKPMALFTKSLEYNNNFTLSTTGFVASTNSTTLLLQNQITTDNLTLKIAGPISFNSSTNAPNIICEINNRDLLFDISEDAESIISNTNKNSISFNKYSDIAKQLSYASKDILNISLPNSVSADYEFYLNSRDYTSMAANDNYLCVGTNVDLNQAADISYWSGKHIPGVQVFSLNNDLQANLIYTYNSLLNDLKTIDTNVIRDEILVGDIYLDANIACLDIAVNNSIAASFNVIVRKIIDNTFVGNISCIVILKQNGNEWNCSKIISQESKSEDLLNILTGIYLKWNEDDLYYSLNDSIKLNDAIKIASYDINNDTYDITDINVNFKATNLYNATYISNFNNQYLTDLHYGFGHKFLIHNDLMFVAAPLIDPYWSNNLAIASVSNSHCGVIFIFKLNNGSWQYLNTIYNGGYLTLNDATNRTGSFTQKLFGYALDYSDISNNLVVSEPYTKTIYRFKIESDNNISLIRSYYKNEIAYGNTAFACNSEVITLSKQDNGILYYGSGSSEQFIFDTTLTDDELTQYATGTIANYNEKIINFKIVDVLDHKYILLLRKFNITYADDSTDTIQKLSLLNLDHRLNTTLFIKVPVPSTGTLTSFISGPSTNNINLTLNTRGIAGFNQGVSLFISDLVRYVTPLFIKSLDPTSLDNSQSLFIRSAVNSSTAWHNDSILFIQAKNDLGKENNNSFNLYLQSPVKDYVNHNAILWIGTILRNHNNNFSLFNYGSSGPSISIDQIITNNTVLFIKSNGYGNDNSAPLFIQTKSGGQTLNLTMFSQGTENNFSLFTNATYGANNNLSFILFSKDAILGINTFIRGYRS